MMSKIQPMFGKAWVQYYSPLHAWTVVWIIPATGKCADADVSLFFAMT